MNILMFIYLFVIVIGMGIVIIVGCLVGGNEKDEVYYCVWKSVKWVSVVMMMMVVFVMIFRI